MKRGPEEYWTILWRRIRAIVALPTGLCLLYLGVADGFVRRSFPVAAFLPFGSPARFTGASAGAAGVLSGAIGIWLLVLAWQLWRDEED